MNYCGQTSEGGIFGKVKKNFFGILIDRSLRFDEHILSQCKKQAQN